MIFKITDGIRNFGESGINRFSKLLLDVFEAGHCLSMSPSNQNWLEEELLDTDRYYGEIDKEIFCEGIMKSSTTTQLERYLSAVSVGDNEGTDLDVMEAVLRRPSLVVLENGTYDWSAICKWILLYRKKRDYRDINSLVSKAVSKGRLVSSNAGGNGGILNEGRTRKPQFHGAHAVKMFSVFDSDKSHAGAPDSNKTIKAGLDEEEITWHELTKRAMENYFPWKNYCDIGCLQGDPPAGYSEEMWDYVKVDDYINVSLTPQHRVADYSKSKMTALSAALTGDDLRTRFAHIGGGSDEIQEIILKIARII